MNDPTTTPGEQPGAATGGVRRLLQAEGLALFASALLFYMLSGSSWWWFLVLFFVPDISFAAYLGGPRIGATVYNIFHATIGPFVLAFLGLILLSPPLESVALIWLAHIGFDRMVGYGLKYNAGFGFTHLGRIGRAAQD